MKNPFRKFRKCSKVLAGTMLAAALFAGCGDSENFVFTNTNTNNAVPIQPVLQAPVAVNDNFQALGNATLQQAAAGVLANDTVNGGTISSFDAIGSNGGTLNLNADGSFTYTPVIGFVGAETFAYTLTNNDGQATATITLTSTGFGRFVDNSGANGTGTQASPFNNLQDAVDAAQSGDTIYVASGDGNNTGVPGGFTLPAGVNLIGEGTGLILAQTIEPAGTAPLINGPINCGGNNLIQGFTIDGSATDLIQIDGVGDVTINSNTLTEPGEYHIDCDNVTGTVSVTNNTMDNAFGANFDYVRCDNMDANATINVTDNTFLNSNSQDTDSLFEIYAMGTSALSVNFSSNTANGSLAGSFDYGFYFENEGTSDCTVVIDNNDCRNFSNECIYIDANPSGDVTGSVSGNMLDEIDDEGITVPVGGGTMTVSGNVISNTNYPIYAFIEAVGGTCIIINNNVTNTDNDAIYIEDNENAVDGKIAIRNNVLTDSSGVAVYVLNADTGGDICCDITGNTVNNNMEFDENGGGTITVERFGDPTGDELVTVNTFTFPAVVTVTNGPVTDAIPGFCAIP